MRALLGLGLILLSLQSAAVIESVEFDDPRQAALYQEMIDELRCLVCQNQNLADSNAELAQDLRKEVVRMIKAGNDRHQVVDFMVARYGNFVLYKPPLNASTIILWVGPFLLLVLGGVLLYKIVRRGRAEAPTAQVDDQLLHKARDLLRQDKDPD